MVKAEIFKKIPVFSKLTNAQLGDLGRFSREKSFKKGEIVFTEKSAGKMLFFVLSGRIKIYKSTPAGHIKILSYLNRGDIFGEMSLFSGGVRSATAAAIEPSMILLISSSDFRNFASKNVNILLKIIATLTARLRKADDEIKSLAYNSVLIRTVFVLFEFEKRYGRKRGGEIFIDFPLTHGEIAGNVGSSREVISRMFSKLEKLKYIAREKGRIVILNPAGLKKIISFIE